MSLEGVMILEKWLAQDLDQITVWLVPAWKKYIVWWMVTLGPNAPFTVVWK